MQHSREKLRDAQSANTDRRGLTAAWNQLDIARKELRRMEHRLGENQAGVESGAYEALNLGEPAASGACRDQTYLVNAQLTAPTARFVDARPPSHSKSGSQGASSRRKVSHIEDHALSSRNNSALGGRAERGVRGQAPAHPTHRPHSAAQPRLRPVKWDHQSPPLFSPPADSLTLQDTLTDSRALRETDIRYLNDSSAKAPLQREAAVGQRPRPHLTSAEVHYVARGCPAGHAALSGCPAPGFGDHAGSGGVMSTLPFNKENKGSGDMGDSQPSQGAVGGSDAAAPSAGNPLQHKFKKSLKDLPSHNNILSQLREKIRKQRMSVSSGDGNQNESGSSGPAGCEWSGPVTPRHLLHATQDTVTMQDQHTPHKLPATRKVAAGPPLPSYKGFCEPPAGAADPHWQMTGSQGHPRAAPKRKGGPRTQDPSPPLRAHPAPPPASSSSSVLPSSTSTPNSKTADKPRKTARVTNYSRKPAKPGRNLITTSSWRAGQEVVARELGLSRPKSKEEVKRGGGSEEHRRHADTAEEVRGGSTVAKAATPGSNCDQHLVHSTALSEDAKKLFSDLHLDNNKVPHRPAVKRKAPKVEKEAEKADPAEKHRHYDTDLVRQYIARQKADRHRKKEEERRKEEERKEKQRKLLEELRSKQRQAVTATNYPAAPANRAKKSKRSEPNKQEAFSYDHEHRILTLLAQENAQDRGSGPHMEVEEEHSDADTLTPRSPHCTPRSTTHSHRDEAIPMAVGGAGEPSIGGAGVGGVGGPGHLTTIHIQGQAIKLDVNAVLSRFSQVLHQHQAGAAPVTAITATPGIPPQHTPLSLEERSKQERMFNLKASARNLQSKIDTASAQIVNRAECQWDAGGGDVDQFVPRYDRIAGSPDDFAVFTSGLPGAATLGVKLGLADPVSPRSHTGSAASLSPRAAQGGGEEDSMTETSTFSEVTAPDGWLTPRTKQAEGEGEGCGAQYRPPATPVLGWDAPRSDPYSVLNVYSRQQRLALRSAVPAGSEGRDGESEGRVTHSQQVRTGRSAQGHPTLLTTTYTRMEASLPQPAPHSPTHRHSRSEERSQRGKPGSLSEERSQRGKPGSLSEERSQRVKPGSLSSRVRSASQDTLDSEEDDLPLAVSSRQASRKASAGMLPRQMSDTGQETDVSQLSEDEPRIASKASDVPVLDWSVGGGGERRWSPGALERQMAAEMARLESLEASLRQLSSAERTRSVALAQQETVSLAQVLKSRQQAHGEEVRSLQLQAQEERLAAAQQLLQPAQPPQPSTKSRSVQAPTPSPSLQQPYPLDLNNHDKNEGNAGAAREQGSKSLEPEDTEYSETFTSLKNSESLSPSSRSPTSKVRSGSASGKTGEDTKHGSHSSASVPSAADDSVRTANDSLQESVRTANDSLQESVKTANDSLSESNHTAQDSQSESETPVKTASQAVGSSAPPVNDGEYSMSFDESEEESGKSKSRFHRPKQARANKTDVSQSDVTGGLGGLAGYSLAAVQSLVREEEMRGERQREVLGVRLRVVKEKLRVQLSLLEQERQQLQQRLHQDPHNAALAKQLHRLPHRERAMRQEFTQHKAEIDRMFRQEDLAKEHRKSLLKQHEEIARMHQETEAQRRQLEGAHGKPARMEVDVSLMEDLSDASDVSYKDYKSDSDVHGRSKAKGDKQKMEKQQKLRLDQKYLTVREQRLVERQRQASELLQWRRALDQEEERVQRLEQTALQAWKTGPSRHRAPHHKGKDPVAQPPPTSAPDAPDAPNTPPSAVDSYTPFSQSGAVSTHISAAESERRRSTLDRGGRPAAGVQASGSESSVGEDLAPDSPNKPLDSSDDTIINTPHRSKGKQSFVGRLLPPGNSPLPQPWALKTNSESESDVEPISHTETQSDMSDYEVRIRQLNDQLQRRRKEADILKKERFRRQKEKLKAQEESLKKQLEAYENYIAQVKSEQAELEQEGSKPLVAPKIKQPHATKTRNPPSPSASPAKLNQDNHSLSDSSLQSPAPTDGRGSKSPEAETKKGTPSPAPVASQLSEVSTPHAQSADRKGALDGSASVSEEGSLSEAIEEAADSEASRSAMLNLQTSQPAPGDTAQRSQRSSREERYSYSQDFSEAASAATQPSIDRPASKASMVTQSVVSEAVETAASQSRDSQAPKLEVKDQGSLTSPPATGIPESDSESESRLNDRRTPSRPSSARSTASTICSDVHDLDDDDLISESDRTPVEDKALPGLTDREKSSSALVEREKSSVNQTDKSSPAPTEGDKSWWVLGERERLAPGRGQSWLGASEEEVSEHIAESLASDKSGSLHTGQAHPPSLYADPTPEADDDELTPTQTPAPPSPTHLEAGDKGADFEQEEEEESLAEEVWSAAEDESSHSFLQPSKCASLPPALQEAPRHTPQASRHNLALLAEDICADLTQSLMDDSVNAMGSIAVRQSPSSTLPKPAASPSPSLTASTSSSEKTPPQTSPMPRQPETSQQEKSPVKRGPPTLPKPELGEDERRHLEQERRAENTASTLTNGLLDDALKHIMLIRRARQDSDSGVEQSHNTSLESLAPKARPALEQSHNTSLESLAPKARLAVEQSHNDSGVEPGADLSLEGPLVNGHHAGPPVSQEPFTRPKSPVPGSNFTLDQEDEEYDFSHVGGEDDFFQDDDLGLNGQAPPLYATGWEQATRTSGGSVSLLAKPQARVSSPQLVLVPHERAEVDGLVSEAVCVFWGLRRCGESWEGVQAPESFLQEKGGEGESLEGMVSDSRRTFRQMLFDLSGEVLRHIYQQENLPPTPPWVTPQYLPQRYLRGRRPPSSAEEVTPLVQGAVAGILGLEPRRPSKWGGRKKDAVDELLVRELRQEEPHWVDYSVDTLHVKNQLTEHFMTALLDDTVQTLTRITRHRHS